MGHSLFGGIAPNLALSILAKQDVHCGTQVLTHSCLYFIFFGCAWGFAMMLNSWLESWLKDHVFIFFYKVH